MRETSYLAKCVNNSYEGAYLGHLTLENIETDTTELVNVGMIDFGQESDLGRGHWIVIWKEQLKLKNATCMEH